MYPFQRFTGMAKRALTLTQDEAEKAHHSHIGTEHLILALLDTQQPTVAGEVLRRLSVDPAAARTLIEGLIGRREGLVAQQTLPTPRVKRVIERAFEAANRAGAGKVGTQHLLVGLVEESHGVAAHVLAKLGADDEGVQAQVAAVEATGDIEEDREAAGAVPRAGADIDAQIAAARLRTLRRSAAVMAVLDLAHAETTHRGGTEVQPEDLLVALLQLEEGRGARVLQRLLGDKRHELIEALRPPQAVVDARGAAREAEAEKLQAAAAENYADAEAAWQRQNAAEDLVRRLEQEWDRSLGL